MTPEAKVREIERRLHDSGLGGDLLLDEMQRLIIQALQAERDKVDRLLEKIQKLEERIRASGLDC